MDNAAFSLIRNKNVGVLKVTFPTEFKKCLKQFLSFFFLYKHIDLLTPTWHVTLLFAEDSGSFVSWLGVCMRLTLHLSVSFFSPLSCLRCFPRHSSRAWNLIACEAMAFQVIFLVDRVLVNPGKNINSHFMSVFV